MLSLFLSGPTLRVAKAPDIPGMHRVRMAVRENRMKATTASLEHYARQIAYPCQGWVLEVGGEIRGFSTGNCATGVIGALFVQPCQERHGYGRMLHDATVDWLWRQGRQELRLGTQRGTRAETFYEAAGWQRAGTSEFGEVTFRLLRP